MTRKLFAVALLTIGCAVFLQVVAVAADPGVEPWPSLVEYRGKIGDCHVYGIRGLYKDESRWLRHTNKVARMFDQFTDTDSLAVDAESKTAWLVTRRNPGTVHELIDWLSSFNSWVPAWAELLARDKRSPNADDHLFELVANREFKDIDGGLVFMNQMGEGSDPFVLRFRNAFWQGEKIAAFRLGVERSPTEGYVFTLVLADSVAQEVTSIYQSKPIQTETTVDVPSGRRGVARLNETTAHCKCGMNQALRIYDEAGECIWKAEGDIYGRAGVWAHDLNRDGVEELVVLSQMHSEPRVLVFERRREGT
jgi:hypothetical protein